MYPALTGKAIEMLLFVLHPKDTLDESFSVADQILAVVCPVRIFKEEPAGSAVVIQNCINHLVQRGAVNFRCHYFILLSV